MLLSESALRGIVRELLAESFGRQTWESMAAAANVEHYAARELVEKFRQLRDQRRISTEKQGQMADITWWLGQVRKGGPPEFERLENFVRGLSWKKSKRPSALLDEDIIDAGIVKGGTASYRVRIPLSEEKSCIIGHGTKQCIAAEEDNAFYRYFIEDDWTIFYIQRVGAGPKPHSEYKSLLGLYRSDRAEAIRQTHVYTLILDSRGRAEVWTAEDVQISQPEFEETTGLTINQFKAMLIEYGETIEEARQNLRSEYEMDGY